MNNITKTFAAIILLFQTLATPSLAHPGHTVQDTSGLLAHMATDTSSVNILVLVGLVVIAVYLLLRRAL